jgi:hypothetical protein
VRVNSAARDVSPLFGEERGQYCAPVPRNKDMAAERASAPDERGRLSRLLLKPPPPGPAPEPAAPRTVDQLKDDYLYASDKERVIGLIIAPVAAVIGLTVVSALIGHDPAAFLRTGLENPKHTPVSLYYEVMGVLAAMAVVMLITAWFRKRLYLGMVVALFGVAVFNLRYWEFGFPFALFGGWYIVRAYRAGRALKDAGITPREVTRKSVREEDETAFFPVVQPFSKQATRPTSPRRRTSAVGR